jgi:uncharacterized protein
MPMEPELLERIRRSYDLFNESNEFDPDLFHPEIAWHNASEFPGAEVHRGIDAVQSDLDAQGEAWESRRAEVLEMQASEDRVAVLVRLTMRGKASGAPVDMDVTHVWTIEAGKARRIEVFVDRKKALRAAGL